MKVKREAGRKITMDTICVSVTFERDSRFSFTVSLNNKEQTLINSHHLEWEQNIAHVRLHVKY